jgi:signal transduction histidine kinase
VTLPQNAVARTHQDQLEKLRREVCSLKEDLNRASASCTGPDGEPQRLRDENRALRNQLRHCQRMASLGTMAAMVAHEFNNILTPMMNYAQLARENPALVDKALHKAVDGSQRAAVICQAILGFSRNDVPPGTEVNISSLVAETLQAMGRDLRKDGIELTYRGPADLSVMTRKVELQQVLLNLVLNARTAVLDREGPRRIEIGAERCADGLVLRVADTGVGIAPEHLKRIFDPHFTTRKGEDGQAAGHGLGLYICREIVKSMDGSITVTSQPGAGATFTVCLPQ